MRTTTLLTLLLMRGLALTGCSPGEFPAGDSAEPLSSDASETSPDRAEGVHTSEPDCGMESCAPIGTTVSTLDALRIPIREDYQNTTMPAWSPPEGEMVRIHIQQNVRVPRNCDPGDCRNWDYPGVCEVVDQDGRLLWRQYGDADQWLHVRGVESIQTRVEIHSRHLGCDRLFGHDHHCTVSEVEVVDSPQVGEPDSSCATYFATDFSDPMDGTLSINGHAYQQGYGDAGYLLLTGEPWIWFPDIYPLVSKQAGSAFATSAISDPAWRVRFSFEIGGGTGADGLTFAFVDARTPDALGGDGSGLGVEGLWGYAIEFDTYRNDNDPNDNHIALIDTLTGEHLVVASDIPRLHDGGLFDAEVLYDNGHLEMWLDGVHTLEATLSNVPNYVQSAAILGFTAATGADYNNHIVDDVIIQPLCDGGSQPPVDDDETNSPTDSAGWAGTVSEAEWQHYGPIEVDAGTLVVTMTGTGDADLYVRDGVEPTESDWDCRPYAGTSDEECRLEGAGRYYVGVRGYGTPSSDYNVSYRIEGSSSTTDETLEPFEVAAEEWLRFSPIEIDGSSTLVLTMTGTGDADLYARKGSEPTETTWDCRPYSSTSEEQCRLESAGTWYFGVRGYASPSSTVTLSATIEERASDVGTEESGTLAAGEWDHFGPFHVAAGTLVATLTGTGDADLYVQKGAEPTSTSYDCRSYSSTSDEECRLDAPGDFYVSVKGYASPSSTYDLVVEVES